VRIEPPDRAIAPSTNDIDAAVAGVLEDKDPYSRKIEFRHGGGQGKGFQRLGSFGHDHRIEAFFRFFVILERRLTTAGNDGCVAFETLLVEARG
jgi:hypothetical protein